MTVRLSRVEKELILSKDVGRLSTISSNRWPHIVPVSFVYARGRFYVPSAGAARKVRNLEKNQRASIVIDDEDKEHGIMLECKARILERKDAEPFKDYMRKAKSWQNDERTLVIELRPLRKVSWFLK